MPNVHVIPFPEFYDAVRRQLGTESQGALPSWQQFLDNDLPDLVAAVAEKWETAPHLPGRGDYRQVWYLDSLNVIWVMTVWRHRVSGDLEIRDCVVGEAPPPDDEYEDD